MLCGSPHSSRRWLCPICPSPPHKVAPALRPHTPLIFVPHPCLCLMTSQYYPTPRTLTYSLSLQCQAIPVPTLAHPDLRLDCLPPNLWFLSSRSLHLVLSFAWLSLQLSLRPLTYPNAVPPVRASQATPPPDNQVFPTEPKESCTILTVFLGFLLKYCFLIRSLYVYFSACLEAVCFLCLLRSHRTNDPLTAATLAQEHSDWFPWNRNLLIGHEFLFCFIFQSTS